MRAFAFINKIILLLVSLIFGQFWGFEKREKIDQDEVALCRKSKSVLFVSETMGTGFPFNLALLMHFNVCRHDSSKKIACVFLIHCIESFRRCISSNRR